MIYPRVKLIQESNGHIYSERKQNAWKMPMNEKMKTPSNYQKMQLPSSHHCIQDVVPKCLVKQTNITKMAVNECQPSGSGPDGVDLKNASGPLESLTTEMKTEKMVKMQTKMILFHPNATSDDECPTGLWSWKVNQHAQGMVVKSYKSNLVIQNPMKKNAMLWCAKMQNATKQRFVLLGKAMASKCQSSFIIVSVHHVIQNH